MFLSVLHRRINVAAMGKLAGLPRENSADLPRQCGVAGLNRQRGLDSPARAFASPVRACTPADMREQIIAHAC